MRSLVDDGKRDLCPLHVFRRIEHSEAEARGEKSFERGIDLRLGDEALFHGVDEIRIDAPAIEIGAGLDPARGGRRSSGLDFVSKVNVVDGAAIRHDVAGEAPFTAANVSEKGVAAARRLSGTAIARP